jgi:hypothetical protein
MIGRERPGEQSEVAQLIQQTLEQERWQREMMEQRYAQYGEDDEEVWTPNHAGAAVALWWLEEAVQSSASTTFPGLIKKPKSPGGAPSLREEKQTLPSENL